MSSVDSVSSASTSSAFTSALTGVTDESLGKDAFLQLLVTQLSNQDPMNPMEDSDFVAQLAQFSSLEQLWQVNDNLESNGNISQSIHNAMMTDMIGKDVRVSDNQLSTRGDEIPEVLYSLPEAGTTTLVITDADGNTVRTYTPGAEDAGEYSIQWDGLDDRGTVVPDDTYYAAVYSMDSTGIASTVDVEIQGRISGVQYLDGSAVLYIGQQEINPSNIVAVCEHSDADE